MKCEINKYFLAFAFFIFLPQVVSAEALWTNLPITAAKQLKAAAPVNNPHINSRRIFVNFSKLQLILSNIKQKQLTPKTIELPMPDGSQQFFYLYTSPVMETALAEKYPQINTYKVVSVENPIVSGRLDLTPNGFHAYLNTSDGEVYIDPAPSSGLLEYYSYYKHDYASNTAREFSCGVKPTSQNESPITELQAKSLNRLPQSRGQMITYRIAVATTGEYSQQVANGNTTNTLAEIVTAINRINEIYQRDLGIRLILVAENDKVIFNNASLDPYSNPADLDLILEQNQNALDTVLGSSAYDIGHVFSSYSGGFANLGSACVAGEKARGESGSRFPVSDPFYIDMVAHEIGHQLGANHSFNGSTDNCTGSRNSATAFEPGSGSTIMSYAGICGAEDLATHSDASFHAGSIEEIYNFTRFGSGNTCAVFSSKQQAPVVNAGSDYTIPAGTAFTLKGSADDPELDTMSYQWDQMDACLATTASTFGTDQGNNAPLFRSYKPATTAERTFPKLNSILNNYSDSSEVIPSKNRTFNFRLTARDGNGGVADDDIQIIVDANSGPFEILQPNTHLILNSGQAQLIQWNTACTQRFPVSCANVDIQLSTDGGKSFSSIINGRTVNDGSEQVDLPNINSSTARIKIACTNNIFFDISKVDFEISNSSGSQLTRSLINDSESCGTANVIKNKNDSEPNNSAQQAQRITIPTTIKGNVNNLQDSNDYFLFIANDIDHTLTLGDYGNNDLDLTLYDASGEKIIQNSNNPASTSESLSLELEVDKIYYLAVKAFETEGKDVNYTLNLQQEDSTAMGASSACCLLLFIVMQLHRVKIANNSLRRKP